MLRECAYFTLYSCCSLQRKWLIHVVLNYAVIVFH